MSTTAPTTPEHAGRKAAPNRSFTLPARPAAASRHRATAEIGAAEGIETLYVHPNGKIVKFTSAARPGGGAGTPRPAAQLGALPWATSTEQTLANGPLEIYRVPGSVSFLHSGSLLHAILPRSNCWCVDGVSKFAMRVLPETYYRIELPGESAEDLAKVDEFKVTLQQVLFYERTACPFARTFNVALPEEPEVRKKKRRSHGPARKWKSDRAYSWKPEDGTECPRGDSEGSSGSVTGSDEEGSSSTEDARSDTSEAADKVPHLSVTTPSRPSVRERARGFNLRSVTAPPQLSLQSTPPSRLRTSTVAGGATSSHEDRRARSRSPEQAGGAAEREPTELRTLQAIPTDMPPSPPDSSAGFDFVEPVAPSRTAPPQAAPTPDDVPSSSDPKEVTSGAPASPQISEGTAAQQDPAAPSPASPNHPDANPGDLDAEQQEGEADAVSQSTTPGKGVEPFVTPSDESGKADDPERGHHESSVGGTRESSEDPEIAHQHASFPRVAPDQNSTAPGGQHARELKISKPARLPPASVASVGEADTDPFAQIQARIQARRSIGGTTSFVLNAQSPTRQGSTSTASSATSLASTKSKRSHSSQQQQQQQQAFATALVRKACAVFLGPPAHLVVIMLRIAARFAKGAFPSALLFESPAGMSKRVPGSFDLDGSDVEDFDVDFEGAVADWEEDDFGVPLRSPIRLAAASEGGGVPRRASGAAPPTVRERRGWDLGAGP